jgi:hypothetical protein
MDATTLTNTLSYERDINKRSSEIIFRKKKYIAKDQKNTAWKYNVKINSYLDNSFL